MTSYDEFASPDDDYFTLSAEQERVVELIESGKNVFFTGAAGTGKSYLLKSIVKRLRRRARNNPSTVAVTATTGVAGLNIGGTTIHSFAGFGLGKGKQEDLAKKVDGQRSSRNRWHQTEILIIDEISMLDGELFDKLEFIARFVRGNQKPFGGIQLVICGDFFQLPPVPERSHENEKPAVYAFHAKSWPKCISRPIFLTKVFRQIDSTFIDLLTNMRYGTLTEEDIQILKSLSRSLSYPDGIEPSQLFARRSDVENHNNLRLQALAEPTLVYPAMDSAGYDIRGIPIPTEAAEKLLERMMAPSMISLKVGAQVMLIQNIEKGVLVNGSLGKIVGFTNLRDATERPNTTIAELPGRSTSNINPSKDFRPLTNNTFKRQQLWPIVKFTNTDHREIVFPAVEFTVQGPIGNVEVRRMQVPLILAWAMSIHKSQGQTLARVKVDLARIFEKGQAYVAISRATSMEGLEIQNFNPSDVKAHPHVTYWHSFWSSLGDGDLPDDMNNNSYSE